MSGMDFARRLRAMAQSESPAQEPLSEILARRMADSLEKSRGKDLYVNGYGVHYGLTDDQVRWLVEEILQAGVRLEKVRFPFHEITDVGFELITRLISAENSILKVIDLEGNRLRGESIRSTPLLSPDCQIEVLRLSRNELTRVGHESLADILETNRRIRVVDVGSCDLDRTACIDLLSRLIDAPVNTPPSQLEVLVLDRPLIRPLPQTPEIADHLLRVLQRPSCCLRNLSMRHFDLQDADVELLSKALMLNNSMSRLDLESNQISVTGANAISSALLRKRGSSLVHLGLANNKVLDDGAIALAEAIEGGTSLQNLTLTNNKIGPRGLQALGVALSKPSALQRLTVFGNNFDDETGRQWLQLQNDVFPFTKVLVDVHVYVVDGIHMIAKKEMPPDTIDPNDPLYGSR